MTGGHCEASVEAALRAVSGVTDASTDREAEQVTVDGSTDGTALMQAVEDAGCTANA